MSSMWIIGRRRRVRSAAVGVLKMQDGSSSAFLFSKKAKIVNVQFYPPTRVGACVKFVELIKAKIYAPGTNTVMPRYDFTKFF